MIDIFEGLTREEIYTTEIKLEEKVPDSMPKYYKEDQYGMSILNGDISGTTKEMRLREEYAKMGMFCFVSWKWINPIVEWIGDRKCLEVMAGRGWLSHALQQKGINIKATDDYSWFDNKFSNWNNTVTNVEKIDAVNAINKYGKEIDVVFMAWAYMDDTAYRVIKELHKVNPNALVVYCGEGYGGCTADENFHEHFETVDDDVFYEAASNYQRWYSIKDYLELGRYSEKKQYGWTEEDD